MKRCCVRLFSAVTIAETVINNEYDCPLYTLTTSLLYISPCLIKRSVSVLHECEQDQRTFVQASVVRTIERESVTLNNSASKSFIHN